MANLIGLSAASDIANAALKFYIRKGGLSQTTQDKPLLAKLQGKQETFPGGNSVISLPVQGVYMSDTAGFLQGYSEDELISFNQAQNLVRAEYNWYEVASGLIITWTELKKDGITVVEDSGKPMNHSRATETRLTSLLKNRVEDFGESWSRELNKMLWADGSADAQHVPGVLSLLTDDPNNGTTGGIARTNVWWRHRARVGALAVTANTGPKITSSPTNQTLSKTLRAEIIQLRRYGGKPDCALCGSDFLEAFRAEVTEKGYYTQNNFNQASATQIGVASLKLDNLEFYYDPTLDDLGREKFCYIIDTRRLKLMPMEAEDNRVLNPEKPYNALVFLQMMTWTGGLTINQLNANGVYEVA